MIKRHAKDRSIYSFAVEGHADFAEYGRDIVCAGVSAVTVGTVNAIEVLLGIVPATRMKNGFLSARMPDHLSGDQQEKLQLLLESMLIMLKSIEQNYGNYIKIQE
jgi:uncharacterized protein YsxB (DUF464 family)